MLPGFGRWTYSRTYLSALIPGRKYAMHTNKNGEKRAFVKTGDYRKVIALDVLPDMLAKAILAEDIELMEQLGILECSPEDFALCSYMLITMMLNKVLAPAKHPKSTQSVASGLLFVLYTVFNLKS